MIKEQPPVTPRKKVESSSLLKKTERPAENFATRVATESLEKIYNIPTGAFSGVSTYRENNQEKRISPNLDKIVAKHFTNCRYITKELNDIGPISTKDPREKYEGKIDALVEKTTADLAELENTAETELAELEEKKEKGEISDFGYRKAKQLLTDAREIYRILIKELELKKRGFELLGEGEVVGRNLNFENLKKMNVHLEIKYLPGGGFVILRGYAHHQDWQTNFGDSRNQDFGLADIYSNAEYVAIEGFPVDKFGDSLEYNWSQSEDEDYDRLMKELVKNGFDGKFLELDGRYKGEHKEKTFDTIDAFFRHCRQRSPSRRSRKNIRFREKLQPKLGGRN